MDISATSAAAVDILKELASKIESGELQVGLLHVGPAVLSHDPFAENCQKFEIHTFPTPNKSGC